MDTQEGKRGALEDIPMAGDNLTERRLKQGLISGSLASTMPCHWRLEYADCPPPPHAER